MCTGILFLFILFCLGGSGYMYYVHRNRIPWILRILLVFVIYLCINWNVLYFSLFWVGGYYEYKYFTISQSVCLVN